MVTATYAWPSIAAGPTRASTLSINVICMLCEFTGGSVAKAVKPWRSYFWQPFFS